MQVRKGTLVRQKEIVSAARKLIVKCGSEHVTVKRVAQEIGGSEAAIYKHFKTKRDVLSFLIDDIQNTLIKDIENNIGNGTNTLQILENIAIEHVSAIEQRKGITFQVIAEIISLGDKKLNKNIFDVINGYHDRIKRLFVEGIKSEVIRRDIDPDAAARLYFSMIQGLVSIWALSQYNFNLISEYKAAWDIFTKSISKPAKRTRS
jgi:AcrR family transcriptional regulator